METNYWKANKTDVKFLLFEWALWTIGHTTSKVQGTLRSTPLRLTPMIVGENGESIHDCGLASSSHWLASLLATKLVDGRPTERGCVESHSIGWRCVFLLINALVVPPNPGRNDERKSVLSNGSYGEIVNPIDRDWEKFAFSSTSNS